MNELVEWKVFIDSVNITFKVFFLFLAFCCFVAFGAKPGNCASLKKYMQLRFEKKKHSTFSARCPFTNGFVSVHKNYTA